MTSEQRAGFVQHFLEQNCLAVLGKKGKEYSRNEVDVNSNFRRVGEAMRMRPAKAAYVYLAKHLDSIAAFVSGETKVSELSEPIEGRIGDAINYLLIIASLLEEESPMPTKTLSEIAASCPPAHPLARPRK